jgi:hypothetical protein
MINDLYREIAARLTGADVGALSKEVRKYANRARVRMQGLQKDYKAGTLPYKTMSAIKDLQQAGLLTKSGNVSLKLPKTRGKLLTVLRKVTGFLVSPTTKKEVKKERKKEQERPKKTRKRTAKKPKIEPPKAQPPKVEQPKAEPPKAEPTPAAPSGGGGLPSGGSGAPPPPPLGEYWGIARDLGLVDVIGYAEIADNIEEIAASMSVREFEERVLEYIENGEYLDDIDFYDTLNM